MTPNMKIKHTIEVLKTISNRYNFYVEDGMRPDLVEAAAQNIDDLVVLLEKPHKTEKMLENPVSEDALNLCKRLFDLIKIRKPNYRQVDIGKWGHEMDKILRLDKRTPEELAKVIDWCQQDDFWKDNILSPAKLRKQLDQLELKMSRDARWLRNRDLTEEKTGPSAKDLYLKSLGERDG